MSLFNMLMYPEGGPPYCPYTPTILAMIGIAEDTKGQYPLGRFRDAYVNDTGERVLLLTRNYGPEYEEVDEKLAANPCFVRKFADQDHTYTYYEFAVPVEYRHVAEQIAKSTPGDLRMLPMDRYRKLIEQLGSSENNAATENAKKVGMKIFEAMNQGEQEGGEFHEQIGEGERSVEVFGWTPPKKEEEK